MLARVVRPGAATADGVPMRVLAEDADWDLALLDVSYGDMAADESRALWLAPSSPPVAVPEPASKSHAGRRSVTWSRLIRVTAGWQMIFR